ncbi:uncharacterized protein BDR25DRAFT_237763 [Lindgomyces ingoldianus]|uniref:Uncharacterized protein n=1 Tax=Lindgomyces ingoldianus TaxID=673940 RepID=A0ACB6QHR5_9PLEO|nr:uncharacterized protein BDR25DRAFT_237763 [Lindgomyces ingoldianus]KAF2466118.1 hypothetical protein BDR25DRAFT_237763 [Lindgomyces ingoldianus]
MAHFPWAGFLSLVAVFLLTVAAVVLLVLSNTTAVNKWQVKSVNIQPQVWLSVLSTLMDGLTAFALAGGATISFWRTTSRGTTLRNMYDIYESRAFLGAVDNLLHLRPNMVAISAILCLASTLRGPLFQRASVVNSNFVKEYFNDYELKVAQIIPPGYLYPNLTFTSASYDAVYDQYVERSPVYINHSSSTCRCLCTGKVKVRLELFHGYGFDIRCSSSKIAWDASVNSTVRRLYQDEDNSIGDAVPAFNTSASLQGFDGSDGDDKDRPAFEAVEGRGWFDVVNLFKTQPVCGGELSITRCSLHHAVVEYAVELRNHTIQLQHPHWQNDTLLFQTRVPLLPLSPSWNMFDALHNMSVDPPWGSTTHWPNFYMAQFNQEISIYSNGGGFITAGNDPRLLLGKRFLNGDINAVNCSSTFRDPTQFTLDRLREMAFRTAVAAANNVTDMNVLFGLSSLVEEGLPNIQNWTQRVSLKEQEKSIVFTISTPYLICAVVTSLLAVVAVVPLYWGWNELPFPASFNPLVVANAFDTPLLQHVEEREIEKYIRGRYGLRSVRFCRSGGGKEELSTDTRTEREKGTT